MMKNIKIPADWKVKKVSELGKVVTGSTPSMSDKSNYNGNFPWVTAQDFKGKYIYDSVIKLSDKGKSKSRIIPAGSVLVTCIASIGLNAIAGVNMATNQQINSIIPNENTNREFLYYLIDNNVNYLKIFAGAGGMLILSKSEFEKIKFAVPPLKEQEKIAEILSAWDKVIELLDRKIDLKSQQKKYLMQILLTGDIRLSGFNAPWNEVKLGDICKIKKGEQLSKLDMFEFAKYPVLNGGQDFSGYTDKFNAKKNTIAISEGGNSCGFVSYVISDFWSGGHCYTIETKINNQLWKNLK